MLVRHNWPGNVRELENTLVRAAVLAAGPTLMPRDLALAAQEPTAGDAYGDMSLEDIVRLKLKEYFRQTGDVEPSDLYALIIERVERPLIELTLERTGGNQLQAAAILGINRNTLRKKIARAEDQPAALAGAAAGVKGTKTTAKTARDGVTAVASLAVILVLSYAVRFPSPLYPIADADGAPDVARARRGDPRRRRAAPAAARQARADPRPGRARPRRAEPRRPRRRAADHQRPRRRRRAGRRRGRAPRTGRPAAGRGAGASSAPAGWSASRPTTSPRSRRPSPPARSTISPSARSSRPQQARSRSGAGRRRLAAVRARCPLPLVAIGGISAATLSAVLRGRRGRRRRDRRHRRRADPAARRASCSRSRDRALDNAARAAL